MSSVEEAIARVGEKVDRVDSKVEKVDGKFDKMDERVRSVELDLSAINAKLSTPRVQWTAVVSAVIPSIISGAALLVIILQFSTPK